jgi:OOP family OmpA-OmpF porin
VYLDYLKSAFLVGAVVLATAGGSQARAQDNPRCKDHPLVKRYTGSSIRHCDTKEFDEWNVPLGNMKGIGKLTKSQRVEGKITWIEYRYPAGRSVLEVYRNFESAFRAVGMQILFACRDDACGPGYGGSDPRNRGWRPGGQQGHITAKLTRSEGDVWASVHVWNGNYAVTIGEVKPMETGMVTVNAAAMAGEIGSVGHTAVYGIYFDTGKADLKPESEPAIAEVVKLLQQNPSLKLWVIGHTDNVGAYQANMDLSRRRAAAVVAVLAGKHGVSPERLQAEGVGPLAPVASNDSEEGRAKNRRVELVKQ